MSANAPAPRSTAKIPQERLRRRREFLRAAKSGLHHSSRVFKLQAVARAADDGGPARFGFTVTKKIAGAVGRNRIRRRLKEALRLSGAPAALPGYDYVFIARPGALTAPFSELVSQIANTLAKLEVRETSPHRRNSKDRPSAS
ncbi:MAG: ribonuclease P protein component [Methylocystaceae bacterium]|nr:MAG: ribonuclease P protein component [Methylocystaceae bacterium]